MTPGLAVSSRNPDWAGDRLGYWPSYAGLQPAQRAAYLGWLNAGRSYSAIGIGYVFLFFYGVERRILLDALRDESARAEVPALLAEVARLRDLYGPRSKSVRSYFNELLSLASGLFSTPDAAPPPHLIESPAWTAGALISLGHLVDNAQPIPASWAMLWAQMSASATTVPPRSRWQPIAAEVAILFSEEYAKRYGTGLVIKAPRSRLSFTHRGAASNRTRLNFELPYPDVMRVGAPVRPLQALLSDIVTQLEPLRSARRRNASPATQASVLPGPLRERYVAESLNLLKGVVQLAIGADCFGVLEAKALFAAAHMPPKAKFNKRDATTLIQALEAIGFGIEPDVRFGGAPVQPAQKVVVFPLTSERVHAPTTAYSAAVLQLHLGYGVAAADGALHATETAVLLARVAERLRLSQPETNRLAAHATQLAINPPNLARALGKARLLDLSLREGLAHTLVEIANADGRVDASEVKLLERIYKTLGLDGDRLHSDLHRVATGQRPGVRATKLDQQLIEDKLRESAQVQVMLAEIFVAVDEGAPASLSPPCADSVFGLNAAHSALLGKILDSGDTIERTAFEDLADVLGLLPDGAIEAINEAAIEQTGGLLLDGDDPIIIDPDGRQVLRAEFATEVEQ